MAKKHAIILELDAETGELKGKITQVEKLLDQMGKTAEQAGQRTQRGFSSASKEAQTLQQAIRRLHVYGLGYLGVTELIEKANWFVKQADGYRQLSAQLKIATDGASEFRQVQEGIVDIARRTYGDMDALAKLYAAMGPSMKQLGKSTEESLRVTELFNKALALSQPTAAEAASATLQFAQAMGAGVLRGEEFNSIMENSRGVAQALADGLGVPIGKLREMAEAGELTADVVVAALEKQADAIEEKYSQLPVTVSRAMQLLKTEAQLYVAGIDESIGVTDSLASAIEALAKNLNVLVPVIGTGLAAAITAKAVPSLYAYVTATRAASLSSAALVGSIRALAITPVGAAITAAAGALAWFSSTSEQAVSSLDDLISRVESLTDGVKALDAAQRQQTLNELNREIERLRTQLFTSQEKSLWETLFGDDAQARALYELNYRRFQKLIEARRKLLGEIQDDTDRKIPVITISGGTSEIPSATGDYYKMLAEQTSEFERATERLNQQIEQMLNGLNGVADGWTRTGNAALDALGSMAAALTKANREEQRYVELIEKAYANGEISTKKIMQLEEARARASIRNSKEMLAATTAMFRQGSEEARAAHNAYMAMTAIELAADLQKAISNAVVAVTNQGKGDPYTAFFRVAAMSAMMAGVLSNIGASFSVANAAPAAVSGAQYAPDAGVLGGGVSESVSNSLKFMQEIEADQLDTLKDLYDQMVSLNSNITALATGLFSTGDIAGLSSNTSEFIGGFAQDAGGFIKDILGRVPLVGDIVGGIVGGAVESLLTGLGFGGTKKSTSDYGIRIDGTLGDAAVSGYETIRYARDPGWFQKTKIWYEDRERALSEQTHETLAQVFDSMREAFVSVGDQLDRDIRQQLDAFQLDIGKISLQGDAEAVQKRLTEAFSAQSDKIAYELFGDLVSAYRKLNESAFDTLSRLVVDKAVVADALEMTGQQIVGDAIALSEALIELAGGLQSLKDAAETYYDKFFTEAEKQARLEQQLRDSLADVNMVLPQTRDGYRQLVEALDLNNEQDRERYVLLMQLAGAADEYYKAIEQAATEAVNDAFRALQRSVDEQKKLLKAQYDERIEALRNEQKTVEDAIRSIDRLRDALSSTSDALLESVGLGLGYQSAQAQVIEAVNLARAGVLPELDTLQPALDALTRNSADQYATFEDFQRDQLISINLLDELNALAGDQKTVEEKTLESIQAQIEQADAWYRAEIERLDALVAGYQAQIDAINGTTSAVLSVEQAIAQLESALSSAVSASASPSVASAYNSYVGNVPSNAAAGVNSAYSRPSGVNVSASDDALLAAAKIVYQSATGGVSTVQFEAAQAAVGGDIYAATGWNGDPESFRRIWGFKTGGTHIGGLRIVGEDGPELELTGPSRIINARRTQQLLAAGNDDMAARLDAIVARLDRLESTTRAVGIEQIKHQQRTARVLTKWDYDGQPEVRA